MANVKVLIPRKEHPHYGRWSNINYRCYNPNIKEYANVGGKGITVCNEWNQDNPSGLSNFANWVEEQLLLYPEFLKIDFRVARIDVAKNYEPSNCCLKTPRLITQNRRTSVLNFNKVVEMRRYVKNNPTANLNEVAEQFQCSFPHASRCLRGISWSNVDSTEPPIGKRPNTRKG